MRQPTFRPPRHRTLFGIDFVLLAGCLALAFIGVVMVYTATRNGLTSEGYSATYYAKRQVIWVGLGLAGLVAVLAFDYRKIETVGFGIYWLCIGMLVAVLVPHLGKQTLGSQRWFNVGPLQVQPSEFAVLALIVGVATYCSRRTEGLTWKDIVKVLCLGGIPIVLVIKQPDLGTGIIMAIVLLVMLAIAGIPNRVLFILLVGGVGLVALAVLSGVFHHYQITRITSFLRQDKPGQTSAIYNLNESKSAIGAGGLKGTGLGQGAQTNLGYVPEQQTDFIFTAVGEQTGFIGGTTVLLLLGLIGWRFLRAAQVARDSFGRILCVGCFAFLAFSAFQNAGMEMGLMPITGIPLPFLSYGGSAVLCFFLAAGLCTNVHWRRSG
jgi:rod shape determining protein RodA